MASKRKVQFNDKVKIHVLPLTWAYASYAARKGPWVQYARDREKFQLKIQFMELILEPVLQNKLNTMKYIHNDRHG